MLEFPMSAGARQIGRIGLRPALKNRHRIAVPRLLFSAITAKSWNCSSWCIRPVQMICCPMSAGARQIGPVGLNPALKNRHRIAVPRLLFSAITAKSWSCSSWCIRPVQMICCPMSAGARQIGRIGLRPALKNRHRIAVPRLLFTAITAKSWSCSSWCIRPVQMICCRKWQHWSKGV